MRYSVLSSERRLIAQLAGIQDVGKRREILHRHRRLHAPKVVEMLYEEVVRLARVDLRQADRLAQAASWIANRLEDDYCRAQGLRAAGHVLLIRGRYAEALESYRSALSLFRRLGRDADVGRTLYGGSLQALIYLGQYEKAFAWALEAREIFFRLGDRTRLARLDTNMGNILYRQDRFNEALECYRRAYEEFSRNGEPQDVAITLRNMAVCYISLADFGKAMATYEQARAHCERNGMPLMVAEADYNIAYLHYQRGEYARAVELYQSTREHCVRLGDPYHKALCDLDQSEMFLELNLDEEGAQLAGQAAADFGNLGMRYEEAKALTFLAIAAGNRGRAAQALKLLVQARRLFAKERNRFWVALIDLYRAVVLYRNGHFERARRLCVSAFSFFSKSSLESKAALCELLRARLHLQARAYAGAEADCRAALKRLDGNESPVISCQAYFVLGQIRELRGDRRGAYGAYGKAHALLENLRSHLKGEELKIAFLKDKLAVYESLVWLSLNGGRGARRMEAAFAYIEQAKSRSLADLIAFRGIDLPDQSGPQSGLTTRVRSLRTVLNWYYRQIESVETGSRQPPPLQIEDLRRSARACEDELVKALSELRNADKQFGVLQNAHAIELDTIRSVIPDDSLLLEYYQARDTLYACVLSRRKLEIVPVAGASRVRSLLRLLQFQLSKFRLGPDYVSRYGAALETATAAHLKELYDELIMPVRNRLQSEHLVIIPHDFLHYLPFHALLDGRRYLTDMFSVSYAPSASVYYLCLSRPAASRDGSLILGIPDSLTPHILDEVRHVASTLPNSRLFIGEEATEERLRLHGPRSRYIHIATHGLFRQDNPMFSSMRLGDSQLSLLDLYSLDLSSELVTLSGCSTGLNAVVGGDELLGLVRGMLYAGTRAVLVTLWDVDDESTADIMKAFYRHLVARSGQAGALRQAMREVRERYPHPYYWSPFVLIGKA
jgi:tetratricopeptide (TPR) repeat protein